jgi:hypothetical protein
MSWASRIENAVANIFRGQSASSQLPPITNAKTPVETAINQAAPAVTSALASAIAPVTATVEAEAKATVQGFLTGSLGAAGAEMADVGLQALATEALKAMSTSGNKTEEEIAAGLESALQTIGLLPSGS